VYDVTALPPLSTGAAHVAEMVDEATDAFRVVGIPGTSGIFAVEKFAAADEPILFTALIVKEYLAPRVRPEISAVVLSGLAVTVATPVALIVYPVSSTPPEFVGAVQDKVACPLATTGAATVGEPGTERVTNVTSEAAVSPSAFLEATRNL